MTHPPNGAMGDMQPHRANLILGLGIASLLCCQPLGIAAVVMGRHDLAEMDAGRMDPMGRATTNVGRVLGIVGVVALVLSLVWVVVAMGLATSLP